MANITKQKRDQMIEFLDELKKEHSDDESVRAFNEIENFLKEKKFGLVFEEHTEKMDELLKENIPVFSADSERRYCKDKSFLWNFIIEGDNLQALYLLEKTHRGKVDCIYIDPPYNTGAKDWKYNNDYVDSNDVYRHSKWLSMMRSRLSLAKRLLNPDSSLLVCTIDDKEYLHLGCLLEEMFPLARIQMISDVINPKGTMQRKKFPRTDEYLFFVWIGDAEPVEQELEKDWLIGNADNTKHNRYRWVTFVRTAANISRSKTPTMFYPIFVNEEGTRIIRVGDSLPVDVDYHTIQPEKGERVAFPINSKGKEVIWHLTQTSLMEAYEKGYVKLGGFNKNGLLSISYLPSGMQKKISTGEIIITGYDENGAVKFDATDYNPSFMPGTQWRIKTHDATEHGTKLLEKFIGHRFSYPKSLYSVKDCLSFYLCQKKDALVLDFFAGSGTTMHAVNLMNLQDGGNRRCILVTNNEVSAEEEKRLTNAGLHKGDEQWEKLGIAKYVTYPRAVTSIEGKDVNGKTIEGYYMVEDEDGNPIPLSHGFECNVKFFKCDWTPRKPEDYLLSNALCLHIKEMIEIENAIEVDGEKNVLLLNKDDIKKNILDPSMYEKAESIWLNQNIVLNSNEMKLLKKKGFKYIPREFFGQELREAAE